jgi:hypothetical protein
MSNENLSNVLKKIMPTMEELIDARNQNISTVLQEVQMDLHGSITRELLSNVTCKDDDYE